MMNESIEKSVILKKLLSNSLNTNQTTMNNSFTKEINVDDGALNTLNDLYSNISFLNTIGNITSYKYFHKNKSIINNFKIFIKKVIRKSIFWFVEPICVRQTKFNENLVTVEKNLIEALIKQISYTNKENANLNQKNIEIEENYNLLNQENIEREGKYELLISDLQKQSQMLTDSLTAIETKFKKLENLDLGIFKENDQSFWEKTVVAQSGEDAISAYITMVLGLQTSECTYIDLGANHAKDLSNTFFFYSKGARGVLVEANPQLISELKFYRHEDIILNKCVSTTSGDIVKFYLMSGDGLSTTELDQANAFIDENPNLSIIDTVEVETISVNDIIEKYMGKAPVILNIDIEGKDMEILQSINFNLYRPLIIIAEMVEYKTTLVVNEKNKEIYDFMLQNDYLEYAFTGINSIFIDKKQIGEHLR